MKKFCLVLLSVLAFSFVSLNAFSQEEAPSSTKSAKSGAMNPDISANVLGLYRNSNRGNGKEAENPNGFSLQEVELQFTADVDPFFRASALIGIHQHHHVKADHGHEHHEHGEEEEAGHEEEGHGHAGGEYEIHPEEAYIETIALPVVTIKAGRFFVDIGKHNKMHTHAFPFIDAPLANQRIFGADNYGDVGVSLSGLIPLPWFSELTVQGVEGDAEIFNAGNANEMVTIGRFRNLFDLSNSLTLDLGVSGASGENQYDGRTQVSGADLTIKWRPTEGGKYASLAWTTEFLQANQAGFEHADEEKSQGLASWVQWQFAQRWWVQARVERFEFPNADEADPENKQSYLIGFFPSEFSALRAQYDIIDDGQEKAEQRFSLQMNVSIGAHPAHAY